MMSPFVILVPKNKGNPRLLETYCVLVEDAQTSVTGEGQPDISLRDGASNTANSLRNGKSKTRRFLPKNKWRSTITG